jgi:hypothetical protein
VSAGISGIRRAETMLSLRLGFGHCNFAKNNAFPL